MISLEYFLGSFLTISIGFFIYKITMKNQDHSRPIRFSQSHVLELTKPFIKVEKPRKKERQSDIHNKKININVLIMDDRAFWIKNNAVYTAEVDNNEILKSSAVQVDMIGMNKVELDKMMFIIDQLTERQRNDSRGSGF